MSDWIKLEKQSDLPEGDWLVLLEEERLGLMMHTASKSNLKSGGQLLVIGGNFHFDMPKITYYQKLPEPPK